MSTPEPAAAPPPNNSAKKWLIGCLVTLVLLVVLGLAAMLLIAYAAKKQMDALGADAHKIYQDAQSAAALFGSGAKEAPSPTALAQGAEARMRLARAAAAVAATESLKAEACPSDPPRFPLTVDAEWFRELSYGVPKATEATPWFRHELFSAASAAAPAPADNGDTQAPQLIELDRGLGDAGSVAVIHTTRLLEPKPLDGGKFEEGRFEGFVQLIGYPDGESICMAPFQASGADPEQFQQSFWAAEEAALGK
jgi:hypothetical protein